MSGGQRKGRQSKDPAAQEPVSLEDQPKTQFPFPDIRWMRGVARALTRGDDDAEDLAQEAWLVALQTPPKRLDLPLRPWLVAVLRQLVLNRRRSRTRRAI